MNEAQKARQRSLRAANKARREAAKAAKLEREANPPEPPEKIFGLPAAVVLLPVSPIGVAFCGLFVWDACSDMMRGSGGTSYDNGLGDTWRCEAQLKKTLKDPGSYQHIETVHTSKATIVKYRSKNSFGGYVPKTFSCLK